MTSLLDESLVHLRELVAFDTRNPPRNIGTGGVFDYLRSQLPGFEHEVRDHGAGAVSLLSQRGRPKRVFNVHLDTVPSSPQWGADPLALRVTSDRAIGLGACDIKGAAACMVTAAAHTTGDAAFLFSTDEEGNDARCLDAFLATPHGFTQAIVAEPTRGRAVLAHRGIASVQLRFLGRAGHASAKQRPSDSALHQAVRWGSAALDMVDALADESFGELRGLRFNIGRVEGGIKANVIAPEASVRFGFRPLPSMDHDALLERFRHCGDIEPAEMAEVFRGGPLPAGHAHAEVRLASAHSLASELGIPIGDAVDFWTEAPLFSAAGLTTFVFGPGDIAQAHTADEWVALDELTAYINALCRILDDGRQ